ncbi:hypothetical protein ACFLTS_00360, partial [Chloroflexota bacterium]
MAKLGWSKVFGRKARCGPLQELAVPTWELIKEAINAGDNREALELVDHCHFENRTYHDALLSIINTLFLTLVEKSGEEAIERFWRARFEPRMADWLESCKTAEDTVERVSEAHRARFSDITIYEEADRYVIKCDPCFSTMLSRKIETGATQKAYPWSWNMASVPYYCVHCALIHEILPMTILNMLGMKEG